MYEIKKLKIALNFPNYEKSALWSYLTGFLVYVDKHSQLSLMLFTVMSQRDSFLYILPYKPSDIRQKSIKVWEIDKFLCIQITDIKSSI